MAEDKKQAGHQPPEYTDTTFVCASSWLYSAIYDCSTKEETDELLQVILRGSQGDYSYQPSSNRAFARTVQAVMRRNSIKRERQQQQRSEAGKSSAKKRAAAKASPDDPEVQKTDVPPMGEEAHAREIDKSAENQSIIQRASTSVNVNVNDNVNGKLKNNTPTAPFTAGAASDGDGFKFLGFLWEYERLTQMASSWQMPAGSSPEQRDRAAWMCSNKRMQPAVMQAIEQGDAAKLQSVCASANNAGMSRELWRLCQQVHAVTTEQLANVRGCNGVEGFRQAVAHEINSKRQSEGTAIFKTIADKIKVITDGTQINSLQGWLASRTKKRQNHATGVQ